MMRSPWQLWSERNQTGRDAADAKGGQVKDSEGTLWQEIRLSEHDRDALAVARRLVMRAINEEPPDSVVWSKGAGSVEPEAVVINLDRLIEDFDIAAAYEAEMGEARGEE